VGEFLSKLRTQLTEFWENTEKSKKIKMGVVAGVIVAIITIAIIMMTRVNYSILYQGLSMKDASEITEQLTSLGVNWTYEDNNTTTILVPTEQVNKVKIQLAGLGLPKDDYDISSVFDNTNWAETEYVTKNKLQIAKTNQLQGIIGDIEGIDKAVVNIDVPNDTTFLNQGTGTASVFVTLSEEDALKQEKVTAIQNLVAGAFQNLESENVAVSDQYGRYYDEMLSETIDASDQLKMQSVIQLQLNRSLKTFLENLYGRGNVDVLTHVTLDFDSKTIDSKVFQPPVEGSNEGLIRNMEDLQESTVNATSANVVGTEPNTEDVTDYVTGDENAYNKSKAHKLITYELNEINTRIIENAGNVKDITIAVVINEDALIDGSMTDDRKKELAGLVGNTAGVAVEKVKISTGKFATDTETTTVETTSIPVWIYAVLAIAALLIIVLVIVIVRRRGAKQEEEENITDFLAEGLEETSDVEEIDYEGEKSEYKVQIDNFIDKKPEAVAALLRTWMSEE
jgi:flagellar M-ring protein FliF